MATLATGKAAAAASSHEEVLGLQLEAAVSAGDLASTQRLLRESESVDPDLLFVACERGHPEIVACLIESGISRELVCSPGQTPLHVAATHGHHEVVDLLLKLGVDAGCSVRCGVTPLLCAAAEGHLRCVARLM